MRYLLDTNACIAIINNRPAHMRANLKSAMDRGDTVIRSSVVIFELSYGVEKSTQRENNAARLATFLLNPMETATFEPDDAMIAGAIRAQLEKVGKPIGAYDLLIAAQAIRTDSILVTANSKEFMRVANLRHEDWSSN